MIGSRKGWRELKFGDMTTTWPPDYDVKYLDPRTAAVLALGEWYLTQVKEWRTGVGFDGYVELHHMEAPIVAALAADAEAAR